MQSTGLFITPSTRGQYKFSTKIAMMHRDDKKITEASGCHTVEL